MPELIEMPSEDLFREPEELDNLEARETLFAMRNPRNLRWKLQVLGREARNPEKGRTLSANCWVRLDKYGNPEIIDESKSQYGGRKFVAARFCLDGIRVACQEMAAFDRTGGMKSIFSEMTDYTIHLGSANARPLDVDWKSFGIEESHPRLWGWSGDHEPDGCSICKDIAPALEEIDRKIQENERKQKEKYIELTIGAEELPEELYYPYPIIFVPYTKNSEALSGPDGRQQRSYWSGRTTDDMVFTINKHFDKIKSKRGAPKDVF